MAPKVTHGGEAIEDALTITGWSALAGVLALAAVAFGGVAYAWKRCVNRTQTRLFMWTQSTVHAAEDRLVPPAAVA